MIRFIIGTTTSERDSYGNCYSFTRITSTKTGKSLFVARQWGSDDGNACALVRSAGLEWSELYRWQRFIGKREYQRMINGDASNEFHEHEITPEMILALEKRNRVRK